MKNKTKHIIKTIEPGSIAEELELEPGDELLRVNGEIIEDVFDYHFQTNDTYLELTIRKKDGEEWDLEIEKEYDEEIGITFENEFMDQYRSCSNNCIFCFIDQMPPGMRPTLYFKDDDSRLSFLQGKLYYTDQHERPRYRPDYPLPSGTDQYFVPDNEPGAPLQNAAQPFCGQYLSEGPAPL